MNVGITRVLGLAAFPLLLGATSGAPSATPKEAPQAEWHRGIEWRAAAGFFSLGSMTVVYPAGPGEPVEVNRRSAETRARWLASVYKNTVAVAADDQLTEEQKKGNLLVLGWSNRLLGPLGAARPFTHDQSGTTFLGIHEPDSKIDLLLFHRNPLQPSTFLLFWSRIDPERDRFQVLPRIGSDWAMYRDYRPVRQGMFVPGQVWPPARDTVAEVDHTSDAFTFPGGKASVDSAHYHVVFDRAALNDQEINAVVKARESAFAEAVAAIGPAPTDFRILLYVYKDDTAKQESSGVPDPAHEVPEAREMHATRRLALIASPRQEIHLLAGAMYGPCFLTAIYEGLALSFLNTIQGQDLETQAALLQSRGRLPSTDVLLDEERFRALPSEEAAAGAGVFMTFLRQSFGATGVKKIYGTSDSRSSAFAAALGSTDAALSASFATWADARLSAHKNEIDFLAAEAEAQQRRALSDWKGMIVALQKALKAKPDDPQTLFNLGSAQMRADDFVGAEASLKAILATPLRPQDSHFRCFSHYQLGRVYDLAGRRSQAIAEYDAVLALADEHGSHALARERKISPATREQLD